MRRIIYVDMDNVMCRYKEAYHKKRRQHPDVIYPQSQLGFFYNLRPVKNSIASIKALVEDSRFSIYILTAPSVKNPACYTEKRLWVERYLGLDFTEKLIISPDKGLLKGDYLIDDHVEGAGQEGFAGELLHFGTEKYPDWEAIMAYLATT